MCWTAWARVLSTCRGNAQLVSYTIHASYIPNAEYIQYRMTPGSGANAFVETELRGIRIAVRQSGACPGVALGCWQAQFGACMQLVEQGGLRGTGKRGCAVAIVYSIPPTQRPRLPPCMLCPTQLSLLVIDSGCGLVSQTSSRSMPWHLEVTAYSVHGIQSYVPAPPPFPCARAQGCWASSTSRSCCCPWSVPWPCWPCRPPS